MQTLGKSFFEEGAARPRYDMSGILAWIITSIAGGALAGYLENRGFQFSATLILQGFLVGSAQWPVLRWVMQPGLARAGWWILLTGGGMLAGWLLWIQRPAPVQAWPIWLHDHVGMWEVFWLNSLSLGFIMGLTSLVQWLWLRRQQRASLWIPLSILGGLGMGATSALVAYAITFSALQQLLHPTLHAAVNMGAGWGVYALITGWHWVRRA